MTELKACPFCGGEAVLCHTSTCSGYIACIRCDFATKKYWDDPMYEPSDKRKKWHEIAIEAWNRRVSETVKVETFFYDKEEIYPDCTVQVLTNTATGETSVGWWKNG